MPLSDAAIRKKKPKEKPFKLADLKDHPATRRPRRSALHRHSPARKPTATPQTLMRCGFRETKTSRASGEEVSETTYYVLAEAWTNEVIKGFDLRKANRLLIELGILIPDSRGKASRQKALPGMGKIRVYWVGPRLWNLCEDY